MARASIYRIEYVCCVPDGLFGCAVFPSRPSSPSCPHKSRDMAFVCKYIIPLKVKRVCGLMKTFVFDVRS